MNDVVKRLRNPNTTQEAWVTMREAADEIERADAQVFRAISRINELESIVERLTAERDALREDAERYRWMRKPNSDWWGAFIMHSYADGYHDRLVETDLDAVIDAARKA